MPDDDNSDQRPKSNAHSRIDGATALSQAGREVVHDDPYRFRAKDVAEKVDKAISKTFRVQPEHIRAWKHYAVRGTYEEGRGGCNQKYCDYKEALSIFMYTREWIDFLIEELSDTEKYNTVMSAGG